VAATSARAGISQRIKSLRNPIKVRAFMARIFFQLFLLREERHCAKAIIQYSVASLSGCQCVGV